MTDFKSRQSGKVRNRSQLQSQIQMLQRWNAEYRTRMRKLETLLKVARCPNSQCIDGAIPHGPDPNGEWEAEQCQWCAEYNALMEMTQ
jgi:hypothetical protein